MQRHRGKSDAAEAGRFFNTAATTNRVGDQRLACARDEETLRTTARQPESLKDTNGVQPSAVGCPSRLVEASADLLAKIGQKYPNLERELEALGCAILDFGVADKKLLFDKFLSITTVMPPDLIRDLFFHLVEWKELPNVN